MNKKEKLELLFKNFPSVGPTQAKRMVNFLLYQNQNYLKEMSDLILNLKNNISQCQICNIFFENKNLNEKLCKICSNEKRDYSKVLVVEKNVDVENIENFGVWDGIYFVLGRNLKINEQEKENLFNLNNLLQKSRLEVLSEITFALSVNPEGEKTKEYIINILKPYSEKYNFKINQLGRGLSLGSEIQYSDKITLLEAFKNIH
ncbi:recombination protein RecR [Candidatus Campbellbacteria bacterium]|nr:MAG: recombination protein RecR [Candidatus Campbellbacteria bacterium]